MTRRLLSREFPLWIILLIWVAALLLARAAGAQTPLDNPRIVEFFPSADHSVKTPSGADAVTRYDFEIYLVGAAQPFQVEPMGKPTPGTDGIIRYDFSQKVAGWPLPGGTYEARVAAVGPNGVGRSTVSNPFTFSAYTCALTVAPTILSFIQPGESKPLTVTSNLTTCTWSVSGLAAWLSASPLSGTGSGTVTVTAVANPTTTIRTATITVAGKSVAVTQAALPVCTYTLAPTTADVPETGGTVTTALTTPFGCNWTAASSQTWATVAPATGNASVSLTVTVSANTTPALRTADITVGGQLFRVTQAGAPPCTQTVTPASGTLDAAGGTLTFTVATGASCVWNTATAATWLTVSPQGPSVGPGTVTVTATSNLSSPPRSASVTIGDTSVAISQAGGPAPPTSVILYALMNIDTGVPVIAHLNNGQTISLGSLPPRVALRAVTDPPEVGSVVIQWDRVRYLDNTAPYEVTPALGWRLKTGTHTVRGTPYADANAGGVAGNTYSITLLVKK